MWSGLNQGGPATLGKLFYWNRLSIFQRNSSERNTVPAGMCPGRLGQRLLYSIVNTTEHCTVNFDAILEKFSESDKI